MLELGSKFLLSYLIGSLMGAMIMGRLYGGVDIRKLGSGNAGGTNALRTQGFVFALGVVIIDIGKGVVGAAVVPGLELPWAAPDPNISRDWLTIACSAAAVMGHVWPVYHNFQGGKGAATLIGTILVLEPTLVVVILVVFAFVLVFSGYVGLSTMTAATSLPILLAVTRLPDEQPLFVYTLCMAAYIIWAHRSNISRMRAGTEHRNPKVMVLRRRNGSAGDDAV